jgi:glycine betaine/proline transport system substrate-binding protein
MRSRRRVLLGSALVSLALVAVACSDVSSSSTAPGGGSSSVPDNSGTTVNFAISPWDGSAANVAVAEYLLKNQLGYSVSDKNIDEYAQFKALSNGDLDATLEVWPSGHADDYKKYIQANNGVVDGGQLGPVGQIGWWIPTYMLQDHPELATWEGLKGNESLFQTADSGSAGRILDGDPSYVTFDQAIADNLGLNLKVAYAGSEAAELTELDTAYSAQKPILMYFWTPHWAQAKYELTMVKLPEVTDQCTKDAADNPDAYACGYPPDQLYKAFNENLSTKAPAAFALLSAMQWTNEDQNGVAADIHGGMDPQEAAQKWVDANQSAWQPWVDAGMAAQNGSPVANASASGM